MITNRIEQNGVGRQNDTNRNAHCTRQQTYLAND